MLTREQRDRYNKTRREDYAKNPDKYKKPILDAYATDPEKFRQRKRDERASNPEAYRESNRKSYKKHSADRIARIGNYRARKLDLTPVLTDEEKYEIECWYNMRDLVSGVEGIEYHVDHIKPLSKGGPHHPANLQILTARENLSKGSRS